jgi:hypothetical protein
MEEIMKNIGEENKEDFLHDLRILYMNIFYPLTDCSIDLVYIKETQKLVQNIHKHVHVHIHIYIYIYTETEERGGRQGPWPPLTFLKKKIYKDKKKS